MRRKIRVKQHVRKDGTVVRGHTRKIRLHGFFDRKTPEQKIAEEQAAKAAKAAETKRLAQVTKLTEEAEEEQLEAVHAKRRLMAILTKEEKKQRGLQGKKK